MISPIRLLVISYSCDGQGVGETATSYNWVQRLAHISNLTLLTSCIPKRKRPTGRIPPSEQLPEARVIEWDDFPYFRRFRRATSALKPGYVAFLFPCQAVDQNGAGQRRKIRSYSSAVASGHAIPLSGDWSRHTVHYWAACRQRFNTAGVCQRNGVLRRRIRGCVNWMTFDFVTIRGCAGHMRKQTLFCVQGPS